MAECDAARWLLANGHATRDDTLVSCRDGKPAFTGKIGWLADHTVEENATVSPHWVKWKPFPSRQHAGSGSAVSDQSGFDDLAGVPASADPQEG